MEDFEYLPAQAEHGSNAVLHSMIETLRANRATLKQRSMLNSFLLATSSTTFRPGNIYSTIECGLPGIAEGTPIRDFLEEVYMSTKKISGAESGAIPACLEITPACDHSAKKTPVARLLLGLLIKIDHVDTLESSLKLPADSRLFAKDVEPIWIETIQGKPAGAYKLVVNARRFISMPVEEMEKHKPIIRLRHAVIADIQSWFSSHASRPGYASVR